MKEVIATLKQSHSAIRQNTYLVSRSTLYWIQAHPPLLDITGSKPGSHFARDWREFFMANRWAEKHYPLSGDHGYSCVVIYAEQSQTR